jgi:hypothetical protein
MPPESTTQAILEKAKEPEKAYNWLLAADCYQQALHVDSATVSSTPKILERIGFCYQLASRQTQNLEEFRKLAQQAVKAYKDAAALLEKQNQPETQGKSLELYALAEYVCSWLASSPSEKRDMLNKSCELAKRSLDAYKSKNNEVDYGRTTNHLLTCLFDRLYVASDFEEARKVGQEAMDYADKAIAILSKFKDKEELLRAYSIASLVGWQLANVVQVEEKAQKELAEKTIDYSEKALELAKEVDNPYYAALSDWAATLCTLLFTEKAELALKYAEKTLEHGTYVRDNYLKGVALYLLTFVTDWMMVREADPDRKKEDALKIVSYSEDAIQCLETIAQHLFIAETCMFYAEGYFTLGHDVETSPEERRVALEKGVNIGRKALKHAIQTGSLDATGSAFHALSKALYFYSNVENRKSERTSLLQEALDCRKEVDKIIQKAFPSNGWLIGVSKNYQGLLEADLAKVETDHIKKKALLERAVSIMEDGISHCKKWISSRPVPTQPIGESARAGALGKYEDELGTLLNGLFLLTKEKILLYRAIETHEDAITQFKKADMPTRVAESYWKMARDQNRLGEYQKAAASFENASAQYLLSAKNVSHFAGFYKEHALYMKAWCEIEKANLAHENEDYASAMRHYDATATFLKQTKSWRYLSSDFFAWSLLEQAEDLSRKEKSIESMETFEKAAESFRKAKDASGEEIDKMQNPDEKEMATELSKASVHRIDYCLARKDVEEARILDRKGEHSQSADKYNSAADAFEKMLKTTETEADRKEIEPFYYMCRAWHKMKIAEKSASPELYREASALFSQAKEHSARDRTTLLASGNNAFCKALEHGTEFEATREKEHFSRTKQYLESAADYYLRAGFDNASEWTNATEMLFDAYNYMIMAEVEDDPQKKTRTYLLAEKCLERSATLYGEAGYISKKEEVFKTLRKVVEKREFALSLGKLFTAPDDALSPSAISAPRLTVEEPVGLDKFEHAFLQANLVVDKKEMLIGESLSLEVQLANSGKDSAFLTVAEDMFPEGFEVIEKPERCAVDDRLLNLKGKKLAPLETGEIRLRLRPREKGEFTFAPTIQFMDEAGGQKSLKLEQVTINVKEMGIRSWLRGQG